jgi:pSer/pThr/pTyr-binding forkhead associated (FHA) protein
MQFRLIEPAETPQQRHEISVHPGDFLIGRGPDCDLRLTEGTISRHHCIIHLGDDEATLVDLGSSNGTFLNGQRVRSRAPLHSGDELVVGAARFVVSLGDEAWPDREQAVADAVATTRRFRAPPATDPPRDG